MKVGGGRFQAAIPFLMFGLIGLGLIVILANYVIQDRFGAPSNWYLLGGLGLILAGIVAATQYQ
ncbi:MAG: cell division protein CrgA [Acidimicrobiia bacterium]|nr:cell division protein CrgA [Acidimicrobiia bacterium]MDH5289275.1 cell division protein CrgA [Acidimicrobiia bacterium]